MKRGRAPAKTSGRSGRSGRRRRSQDRGRRRLGGDVERTEAERLAEVGWVEWGGELLWAVGFTAGGAPFGLRARELDPADDLDLVGPAFIELGKDGIGHFAFIAVEGWIDCRETPRGGRAGVEFSWEGGDDCDPASGRGWAALQEDGSLRGRIYFHLGDDSSFHAVRADDQST